MNLHDLLTQNNKQIYNIYIYVIIYLIVTISKKETYG